MEFSRHIARLLHEEHRSTIAMLEGLENMIARAKKTAPDVNDPVSRKILQQMIQTIEQEVSGHFAFEEAELFTRLAEFGDEAIGEHLTQEHQAMLPIAEQAAAMANNAMNNGFSDAEWNDFRSLTGELIERMLAHIQKEEMALLPMLEDLIDSETDMTLAQAYSMQQ